MSTATSSDQLNISGSDWTQDGIFYEYSQAADPMKSGATSPIPCAQFPASLHAAGMTRVIPLDLSERLGTPGPASSPGLCANFVRISSEDSLELHPNASSQLYYILSGRGEVEFQGEKSAWEAGDFLTFPAGSPVKQSAFEDSVMYWVHDEPLLRYLGCRAESATFRPTLYRREDAQTALKLAAADPDARKRSRISVLLANRNCPQTLTVTPMLWAMFGILPVDNIQAPHRHQSVALDLIIDCQPGCYTLVGRKLNEKGEILDPQRVDWSAGGAFVTPPGYWHAHFNESGSPAYLLPIQDAGLQTYLRTLDIQFR